MDKTNLKKIIIGIILTLILALLIILIYKKNDNKKRKEETEKVNILNQIDFNISKRYTITAISKNNIRKRQKGQPKRTENTNVK